MWHEHDGRSNRDWLRAVYEDASDPSLKKILLAIIDNYDDILFHGELHGVTFDLTLMPEEWRRAMYHLKGRVFPPLPPQSWEDMQILCMLKECMTRTDQLSWLLTGIQAYLYSSY